MSEQSEQDEYLTIQQAKELYGYSHMTIYRLRADGRLTFYRRPRQRHTLLKRSELDALRAPQPKG